MPSNTSLIFDMITIGRDKLYTHIKDLQVDLKVNLTHLIDNVPNFHFDDVVCGLVVPLDGGHLDLVSRQVLLAKITSLEPKTMSSRWALKV